ncbi:type II secretion system protein G [Paraburkholderia fungorum]|uniref:Type II secretion system protein G n=1 Tax=Paraburkholderia fungorum TaxID=134537 RepID=A0AAU8TBM1_9BURK|nr:type II secretion system protein G [Paraburkholderia fungorum]
MHMADWCSRRSLSSFGTLCRRLDANLKDQITMKAKYLAIAALLALAGCKPTHISFLDRIYTVEEFDQQPDLRKRVTTECSSNQDALKNDSNCVNSNASQIKADAEAEKKKAEEQAQAAKALAAAMLVAANPQAARDLSRQDEARRIAAKQDIGTMMQALKLYRLDNGMYPTQEQGLRALVEKPTTQPVPNNWKDGGYLERMVLDPWGNSYQFLNPGVHGEIDLFSYGADGKPGGEGNDADIGSWQ